MFEPCFTFGLVCIMLIILYLLWYMYIRSNLIENLTFGTIIKDVNTNTASFDDIMNSKCEIETELRNPNYLGPWDGLINDSRCGKFECPLETCYYLEDDPTFPTIGGKTWSSKSIPKIYNASTKTCETNHNPNNRYFCDSESKSGFEQKYKNDENHFEKKKCYVHKAFTINEHVYYNVLSNVDSNGSNIYTWSNEYDIPYDEDDCKESKLDCSACNYYCCEYNSQRRCDGTPNTLTSDDMDMKVVYRYNMNDHTCVKDDDKSANCFGTPSCFNSVPSKDCWQFDSYNLSWRNDKYKKKIMLNGDCVYLNTKGDVWDDSFLSPPQDTGSSQDPFCLSDLDGKKTNEDCNKLQIIHCDYIDVNEQHQTVTYEPKLNYAGNACIWKTLDKRHFIQPGSLQNNPHTDELPVSIATPTCPELTPQSCKNSNNEYLHSYGSEIAPECVKCPVDMYRNSKMESAASYSQNTDTINADIYCTPKIDSCDDDVLQTKCIMKKSSDTNSIFKEVVIPMIRNDKIESTHPLYGKGDACVLDSDWAEENCERQVIPE